MNLEIATILLASKSEHKIAPVTVSYSEVFKRELRRLYTVEVESGVGEQPFDYATVEGAERRLENAIIAARKRRLAFDLVIAIESGLFTENMNGKQLPEYVDRGVVVAQKGNRRLILFSEGVVFPYEYIERTARKPGGFEKNRVGATIAEATGCSPTDPQSFLTNGKLPRRLQLHRTVRDALEAFVVL